MAGCKSTSVLQKPAQKVVLPEDAETLIGQGYRFIGVMPNGKVVVEKN